MSVIKTRTFEMTFPENEAEIYLEYKAAKGQKTMADLFRYFAEPVMKRNKVKDLHTRLINCRIENHKNAEIERKKKKHPGIPVKQEDSK